MKRAPIKPPPPPVDNRPRVYGPKCYKHGCPQSAVYVDSTGWKFCPDHVGFAKGNKEKIEQ